VGRDDKTRDFAVYKKLIRESSEFVDNALESPHGSTDRIVLDSEDDGERIGSTSPTIDNALKSTAESTDRVVLLPDIDGTTFDI
jgi:hypothetical protein